MLGKKLKTSDLDKLYWVKFLQKKFPNLGKRGNKDDIEKELLKEFGDSNPNLSSSKPFEESADVVSNLEDTKMINSTKELKEGSLSARDSATHVKSVVASDNEET